MAKSKTTFIREQVIFSESCMAMERSHAPLLKSEYHFHPEIEVTFFVKSGPGIYIFENCTIPFTAGDCFIISGGIPHHSIYSPTDDGSDCICQVIKFPQSFPSWLQAVPDLKDIAALFEFARKNIVHFRMMPALLDELEKLMQYRGFERFINTLMLLQKLARSVERNGYPLTLERDGGQQLQTPLTTNSSMYQRLVRAIDYIQKNLASDLTLAKVAAFVKLPPETFRKLFRRSVNAGFSDYVVRLRLAHACRLLRDTSSTILTIAMTVGFRNLSNFNRLFHKHYRCTPSQFRNER